MKDNLLDEGIKRLLSEFNLVWDYTEEDYINQSEASWVQEWLIWCIDQWLQLCGQSPWCPTVLHICSLCIQRMEKWGRPVRKQTSFRHPGDKWGMTKPLNLSLSLEDWVKLQRWSCSDDSSPELACDWAWRGGGACLGHRKHENLFLCSELCSCFSAHTLISAVWGLLT